MKRLFALILLLGSSSLFAQTVSNATIATDKNTYSPGDIVTITGTGWTPGETVTIDLDAVSPNRVDHTLQSIADADGNFVNQDFSGQDGDVGTHYNVTATGSASGVSSTTDFTINGKRMETGKPDVVRLHGPISQDRDVRDLPYIPPREGFEPLRLTRHPMPPPDNGEGDLTATAPEAAPTNDPLRALMAAPSQNFAISLLSTPAPSVSFEGINSATSGCGCLPPDTDGDVGPNHYIQSVNSGIRIFSKTGAVLAPFTTYNSFFSALGPSTPCGNRQNDGDGVVFYDHMADRWVVSDFAFPAFPGTAFYQCIGVSKTPDPVSGGWWLYATQVDPGNPAFLGDYPKFGLWNNAYFMTNNLFSNNTTFNGVRVYAFERSKMLNGAPAQSITFMINPTTLGDAYSLVPATFRFGGPPAGRDEFLLAINSALGSQTAVLAWKFHVDFATPSNSTLGADINHSPNATITVSPFTEALSSAGSTLIVPQTGTTAKLDTLGDKLMYPMQYQNLNGTESLYVAQTVGNNPTSIRWYQFDVTGGLFPAAPVQQQTFTNGNDGLWRWMPSLGVDANGNLGIDYTVSSASLNPSIRYAARLANDPLNDLTQGEQLLVQGGGHQTSTSGRWGDYSATAVDVSDGCTFWHTNEYYPATGSATWSTRVGAFKFGTCGETTGTLQGTVTRADLGTPVAGALVILNSRTATTDGSGFYQFASVPAGSYTVSVSSNVQGLNSGSVDGVTIVANATTNQNFALTNAITTACLTDQTEADFEGGTPTNVNVNPSLIVAGAGSVSLPVSGGPNHLEESSTPPQLFIAQILSSTSWAGQTFQPTHTGPITKITLQLGLNTGATQVARATVELHDVVAGQPGPNVLATTTTGNINNVGSAVSYTVTFTTPPTITAGTSYALVLKQLSTGGPVIAISGNVDTLANGNLFTTTNSGTTWSGFNADLSFQLFQTSPFVYSSPGNLVSSAKDTNPPAGALVSWSTLSWTATTPANTSIQFQAAASNDPAGPFNFVGPDGTAGTFFTNGGSLAQFNGNRYLKYKALLSTSDTSVAPTLTSVAVCYNNILSTTLSVAAATATYGGTTNLSATMTSGGVPVSGKSVTFTLNGNSFAGNTAVTNASGIASLTGVSVAGIRAGTYPNGVSASFSGDGAYLAGSGSNSLTINQAVLTVTADNAARLYGTPNPLFTASFTGFKNNETLGTSDVQGSPSVTTAATQASAPGTYPIVAALGTLSSNNYSFVFVNGTLKIYVSGLVGLDSVSIGSTKAVVDSFDSSAGYTASHGNNAPVFSNGAITISGAKIGGSIVSAQGSILLGPNSTVSGDVTAGTTITNQGTVGGSVNQNRLSGAIVAPPVADCGAFTLNPAISGGTFTYSNGDLAVAAGQSVTLGNGSYCFHNITLSGQASLQVSGPVLIRMTGVLNASGGSLVNTTQVPSNLQIASSYSGAGGVAVSGGTNAYFTIYAPNTSVTATGGSPVFGALLGKTLTISGNSAAHYDTQLPNIWSLFFGF